MSLMGQQYTLRDATRYGSIAPFPAIRSTVEAKSRDHASNPAGSRSIAQKLCHAKAMEREDRRQIGSAKGIVRHHGRREHNPWPGISKHGHAKVEVPIIRAGDEFILALREQGPAPYPIPHRVIAPCVNWPGQVCARHAGDAERLHQMGPQNQELLENLRQVAEHRRIDQNNVLLRGARRYFKTVQVVDPKQTVSKPALWR